MIFNIRLGLPHHTSHEYSVIKQIDFKLSLSEFMIRKNELYNEFMNNDFPYNSWPTIIFHLNQGSTDQNQLVPDRAVWAPVLGPNRNRASKIKKSWTVADPEQF